MVAQINMILNNTKMRQQYLTKLLIKKHTSKHKGNPSPIPNIAPANKLKKQLPGIFQSCKNM
jgi:hypothetical protein